MNKNTAATMMWVVAQVVGLLLSIPVVAILLIVGAIVVTQKRDANAGGGTGRRSACACGIAGHHIHTGMVSDVNTSLSPLSRFLYLLFNSALGQYYWNHKVSTYRKSGIGPHTNTEVVEFSTFLVMPVAVDQDNYAYLLVDKATGDVAAVDPADPDSIVSGIDKLNKLGILQPAGRRLRLTTVLTTHGHYDHDGGNAKMVELFPGIRIVGGSGDGVIGATVHAKHGDTLFLGNEDSLNRNQHESGIQINVLKTPCHTPNHVCYHIAGGEDDHALFSGDTLFVAGVGKFFEGDGEAMSDSLFNVLLGTLPHNTKLFCGHEYTVQNLKFASLVEPQNPDIRKKLDWSERRRLEKKQTIPSTLEEELKYNPFLRIGKDSKRASVMCAMRRAKDEGLATVEKVAEKLADARK